MKNQKGITLIALVITIIVLLILAGVSIAMLTGENGILSKATEATTNTKQGEAKEAVRLGVATIITEKEGTFQGTTSEQLKNAIQESNTNAKVEITDGEIDIPDADGNPTKEATFTTKVTIDDAIYTCDVVQKTGKIIEK